MITCRELIEVLDEYLDGGPPPPGRARIDEHLAVCPDCVNYIESYQGTVRLGRAAFANGDADAPVPAEVPESLIRAVAAARQAPAPGAAGAGDDRDGAP